MKEFLKETHMLDFNDSRIQSLIENRGWKDLEQFECIKAIYLYVRDEILFGYNIDDSISASKVLSDGYGQCNTKGTLFMALLRACKIPCRVHGFTIDKQLQKGAMTGIVYKNAPQNVFHSWVEVYLDDTWYELEAFILDKKYLNKLQKINSQCSGAFCGYGRTMPPSITGITLNLLRIPMALALTATPLALSGIWWSISITSILKGLILFIWFQITIKKK